MKPKLIIGDAIVYLGSNLDVLPELQTNSIDSIVCDPPYELGFMSKTWDSSGIAYSVELWQQCLRVLKPGGHLLAFGGSRTWHRLAVAIEDAGFEIRDNIAWLYGSGFPKSLNVSKSIEAKITTGSANKTAFKKLQGEQLERGNWGIAKQQQTHGQRLTNYDETAGPTRLGKLQATTPEAQQWEGWGTALKPAHEPIVVARKPVEGTVANNVLTYGTGALNIDATRISTTDKFGGGAKGSSGFAANYDAEGWTEGNSLGRWPANIILDEFTAKLLDEQSDASRFFYVAKANKKDRNEGLDELPIQRPDLRTSTGMGTFEEKGIQPQRNFHPTVKPTLLMQYLIRLVTPDNGIVLDPFTGSGSTGKAAILEGKRFVGIELTAEYLPIIEGRLKNAYSQKDAEDFNW
jgi:DNA modification methylase